MHEIFFFEKTETMDNFRNWIKTFVYVFFLKCLIYEILLLEKTETTNNFQNWVKNVLYFLEISEL